MNEYKNIPEKEERIKICISSTCDNCPLSNVWCFEDSDKYINSEQQEFNFVFD